MRNLISIFMILALVVATTLAPSVSHAMPHNDLKANQAHASAGGDCHHQDGAKVSSEKIAQNDKNSSNHCCDKGMCKCAGGNCHNGLAKNLSNESSHFALSSSKNQFSFANELLDSALSNRLKRPPKA